MTSESSSLTQPMSLLSKEEWGAMYPAKEYINKSDHAKKHPLHYLLGRGQSDRVVLPYIKKLSSTNSIKLFARDNIHYNLTPLMIAAMRGRLEVVKALMTAATECRGKAQTLEHLNLHDNHQWTALHHSAVSSKEIYDYLVKNGVDTNSKTSMGGRAKDLKAIASGNVRSFSAPYVTYINAEGTAKKVSELTSEQLGFVYRDFPVYSEETVKAIWSGHDEDSEVIPTLTPLFLEYIKKPTKLTVKAISEMEEISAHALGLYADEEIECGKIVGLYGGERKKDCLYHDRFEESFDPAFMNEVEFYLNKNDAREVGGPIRFANWGFPNAIIYPIWGQGVVHYTLICIKPEGIKKGEQILWNYGPECKGLSFSRQLVFDRDAIRTFFKPGLTALETKYENKIKNIKTKLSKNESINLKEYMITEGLHNRILFPINMPLVILDLHFNNIVPVTDWHMRLNYKKYKVFSNYVQTNSSNFFFHEIFILNLIQFEKSLDRNEECKKMISEWILQNLEKYSAMQFLKAFSLMQERGYSPEALSEIEVVLEEYCWITDPDAPMSRKKLLEHYIKKIEGYNKQDKIYCLAYSLRKLDSGKDDKKQNLQLREWVEAAMKHFGLTKEDLLCNM